MKAGKLVKAPNALPFAGGANEPKTIGALAAQQSKIKCESPLSYDRGWADRLPAAFSVYPRATVREAAGVKDSKCNLRVVNFQTAASLDRKSVVSRKSVSVRVDLGGRRSIKNTNTQHTN